MRYTANSSVCFEKDNTAPLRLVSRWFWKTELSASLVIEIMKTEELAAHLLNLAPHLHAKPARWRPGSAA